jgi:hypothetical protein
MSTTKVTVFEAVLKAPAELLQQLYEGARLSLSEQEAVDSMLALAED